MIDFAFETDAESKSFCIGIVKELMKLFGISEQEAVGRINRQWSKLGRIVGPNDIIYHESPEDWAKMIYYGTDTKWWRDAEQLKPKPFP